MELKRARCSFWEYIVVAFLVAGSFFLSFGIYAKRDFLLKHEIARLESLTLRNYVTAYLLEYKKYPSDFQEVIGLRSSVLGLQSSVIGLLSLKDPFGDPYQYDPKTGWVTSKNLP